VVRFWRKSGDSGTAKLQGSSVESAVFIPPLSSARHRSQAVVGTLAELLHKQLPRGGDAGQQLRQQRQQLTRQLLGLLGCELCLRRCVLQKEICDALSRLQLLLVLGGQLDEGGEPAGGGDRAGSGPQWNAANGT
jgi:hypothetical protein